MNMHRRIGQQCAHWGSRAASLLVFTVGVTVLLLWLAGKFAPAPQYDTSDLPFLFGRRFDRLLHERRQNILLLFGVPNVTEHPEVRAVRLQPAGKDGTGR